MFEITKSPVDFSKANCLPRPLFRTVWLKRRMLPRDSNSLRTSWLPSLLPWSTTTTSNLSGSWPTIEFNDALMVLAVLRFVMHMVWVGRLPAGGLPSEWLFCKGYQIRQDAGPKHALVSAPSHVFHVRLENVRNESLA